MVRAVRAAGAAPLLVAPRARREQGVRPHVETKRPEALFLHTGARVYRSVAMTVAAEEGVPLLWIPTLTGDTRESGPRFLDWCHPDEEGLCMLARELAPLVLAARSGAVTPG